MTHLTSISLFQDGTCMSVLIIRTTKGYVDDGEKTTDGELTDGEIVSKINGNRTSGFYFCMKHSKSD